MLALLLVGSLAAPVPKVVGTQTDLERLQGKWEVVLCGPDGMKPTTKVVWTFDENMLDSTSSETVYTVQIDPKQSPKHIDFGGQSGLYEFDGDRLRVFFNDRVRHERPTALKAVGDVCCVELVRLTDQTKK